MASAFCLALKQRFETINLEMAYSLFTCPWRRKVEDGSSSHSAIHSNLSATSWADMNDIFHGVKTEWNEATSSVTSIK